MGKILGLGEKNFWNFSLRTLARFTKSPAAAHRGARNRHRQRFVVRRAARSAARIGSKAASIGSRTPARRRSSRNCRSAASNDSANARFRFFRRLFFPRSHAHVGRRRKRAASSSTNGSIALGERRKISVIPVSGAWYGFDPIHLKRSRAATRLADVARRVARRRGTARDAPRIVAVDGAYLASLAPLERSRYLVFGAARRNRAVVGRRNDDFALLNRVRDARKCDRFDARSRVELIGRAT